MILYIPTDSDSDSEVCCERYSVELSLSENQVIVTLIVTVIVRVVTKHAVTPSHTVLYCPTVTVTVNKDCTLHSFYWSQSGVTVTKHLISKLN